MLNPGYSVPRYLFHRGFSSNYEGVFPPTVSHLMAILLASSPSCQNPNSIPTSNSPFRPKPTKINISILKSSRRDLFLKPTTALLFFSLGQTWSGERPCSAEPDAPLPPKASPLGIANTKAWFQSYGDGFSIRVPPQFEDIMEPKDYNAGLSLYGDKTKPRTFAARFASPDWTYYFYEFGRDEQHVALVATVDSGKAYIAGATAPQSKLENDGVKLRSTPISMTLLKTSR